MFIIFIVLVVIMANCQSHPDPNPERRNDNYTKRTLSSPARFVCNLYNKITSKVKKQKKEAVRIYNLATSQIVLFHIKSQISYKMYEHQYFLNIVMYQEYLRNKGNQSEIKQYVQDSIRMSRKIQEKNRESSDVNCNIDEYPYNCLGLIYGTSQFKGQNKQIIGTGCLVAPNLVLTAASLVLNKETGLTLSSLKFYPKLQGNLQQSELQSYQIIQIRFQKQLINSFKSVQQSGNDDYALLLLNKSIQRQRYVYLGYDMNKQGEAELYGYSLDLVELKIQQAFFKQIGMKGKIVDIQDQSIYHNIDARKTEKGAPLIVQFSEGFIFAIGIHSQYSNIKKSSLACKLTSHKIENLRQWAKQLTNQVYQITAIKMINIDLNTFKPRPNLKPLQQEITNIQKNINDEKEKQPNDNLRYELAKGGQLYWRNGQYDKSISYLQKGLDVCQRIYGQQSFQSAFFYSNLGLNYDKLKQFDKALVNFNMALKINLKKQGEECLNVATAYNNIGNLYKRKGQLTKAYQFYDKSLKIKKKLFGDKNQSVAASLTNIALLQWQKKNYVQAIKKYKQGLKIFRSIFGPIHYEVARTLYNLSLCYFDIEQYNIWLQNHFQSLAIMEQLQLTNHPSYSKRKRLFFLNIQSMLRSTNCTQQIVMKAVKMTHIILKPGQSKHIKQELRIKMQSFQ